MTSSKWPARCGASPFAAIELLLVSLGSSASAAPPDERGPFAVEVWSAGDVAIGAAELPVKCYLPVGLADPTPIIVLAHGYLRTGFHMRELAATLASHGFVAVVPDLPCGFGGCDHFANSAQISTLFSWAEQQSGDPNSPLYGRIDGDRRAVAGHSWGGLAALLATSDPELDAIVLLEPRDDFALAVARAPFIGVPSLHMLATAGGLCSSDWGATVLPRATAPALGLRIEGANHCDAEDPTDATCEMTCGAGDRNTTPIFRRYAVAFLACSLRGDRSSAPYIGGTALEEDEAAGTISRIDRSDLGSLLCQTAPAPDPAPLDAGGEADAAPAEDAAVSKDSDPIDRFLPAPASCSSFALGSHEGVWWLLILAALHSRFGSGARTHCRVPSKSRGRPSKLRCRTRSKLARSWSSDRP
jgi:dienelactone hydrolase